MDGMKSGAHDAAIAQMFEHRIQGAYGKRLHYVIGGQGDPVLLVAGWPQTWYAWRKLMPALARQYTVVAVDLPGLGDSDKPVDGYDTRSVAARLHELIETLGWGRFHYVGHDIGCWVGYPYAATYRDRVRKLALLDSTLPGVVSNEMYAFAPERIVKNWHFFFNALPDLPEALLTGREREFLAWLFHSKARNPAAIEPAALDEYVRCYSASGGWRAATGYYRALFDSMEQNREHMAQRLTAPVLAVGGESGMGAMMEMMMRSVADDVTGLIVPECGHYVPEEAPAYLLEHLCAFLG